MNIGDTVSETRQSRYAARPSIRGIIVGRMHGGLMRVQDGRGDVHTLPAWTLYRIEREGI